MREPMINLYSTPKVRGLLNPSALVLFVVSSSAAPLVVLPCGTKRMLAVFAPIALFVFGVLAAAFLACPLDVDFRHEVAHFRALSSLELSLYIV